MASQLSTTCFALLFAGFLLHQGFGQGTLDSQDLVEEPTSPSSNGTAGSNDVTDSIADAPIGLALARRGGSFRVRVRSSSGGGHSGSNSHVGSMTCVAGAMAVSVMFLGMGGF